MNTAAEDTIKWMGFNIVMNLKSVDFWGVEGQEENWQVFNVKTPRYGQICQILLQNGRHITHYDSDQYHFNNMIRILQKDKKIQKLPIYHKFI